MNGTDVAGYLGVAAILATPLVAWVLLLVGDKR